MVEQCGDIVDILPLEVVELIQDDVERAAFAGGQLQSVGGVSDIGDGLAVPSGGAFDLEGDSPLGAPGVAVEDQRVSGEVGNGQKDMDRLEAQIALLFGLELQGDLPVEMHGQEQKTACQQRKFFHKLFIINELWLRRGFPAQRLVKQERCGLGDIEGFGLSRHGDCHGLAEFRP